MSSFNLVESKLDPARAVYDFTLPAGEPWLHEIKKGQVFRILDLEGNQAVDTLFYSAANFSERYSAQDTLANMFGAVVGSFLNVVIWRLPRGESIVRPPSHCPN